MWLTKVKLLGEAAQFLIVVNGHSLRIYEKKPEKFDKKINPKSGRIL